MTEPGSPAETEHTSGLRAQSITVGVERRGRAVVLTISGEVDALTAPRLADAIERVWVHEPEVLVADLEQVAFLASAGLSVLLMAREHAARRGCELRVVAGNRETFRPLHLTGIDGEIAVFESCTQALSQ